MLVSKVQGPKHKFLITFIYTTEKKYYKMSTIY